MITGYSLSPGGLLFPWHIGALTALTHYGYLDDSNPIAGSSAGAIAVASHAAKVSAEEAIDATVRMSDECKKMGGARGNLLPLLSKELNNMLDDDVHEVFNNRPGFVGLAYKELFPNNRAIIETQFDSKNHVVDSVCNSSMFPFFSTNWPCRFSSVKENQFLPRIAVDGFFTVPRERFGCPDLDMVVSLEDELSEDRANMRASPVDRTITISVFPHETISLTASEPHDQISPTFKNPEDPSDEIARLFRLATETAEKEDYYQLYEDAWVDVERWIKEEENRASLN